MVVSSRFFADASSEPKLYHIAAVGPNFNRIPYAIECFVALIFSSPVSGSVNDYEPNRLRLDPLVADESQSGPSSIELMLHGRWRGVFKGVQKKDIVRIECATVTHALDQEIHPHQLELFDPVRDISKASFIRIFVQFSGAGHDKQFQVAVYESLAQGLTTYHGQNSRQHRVTPGEKEKLDRKDAQEHVSHLSQYRASLPGSKDSARDFSEREHRPAPRSRKRSPKFSVLNSGQAQQRNHEYALSIRALWDRTLHDRPTAPGEKINVYGVIIEARGPCITKGTDMRSEVVIVDESSPSPTSDCADIRTLRLHRFELLPQDSIPFCSVGDVIRAHRVHLDVYEDRRNGVSILQGSGRYYSTYVLWSGASDSHEPIATLQPVRTAKSSERPDNVQHTITDWDRARVAKLRVWGAGFLKASEAIDRPFLHTVPQMLQLLRKGPIRQPFDLICYFEREEEDGSENMQFYISGRRPECAGGNVLVKVIGCPVDRVQGDPVSFEMFSPSWRLRKHVKPSCLLIHDAYCLGSTEDAQPLVHLMAGDKTSTIIWLRDESPELRFAAKIDSCGIELRGNHGVSVEQPGNTQIVQLCARESNPAGAQAELTEIQLKANQKDGSLNRMGTREHNIHHRKATNRVLEARRSPAMAERVVNGNAEPHPKKIMTSEHVDGKIVITTHGNVHKQFTPLKTVRQQALALGHQSPPFRVLCRVVAWTFPDDMYLACQPWCASCSSFLLDGTKSSDQEDHERGSPAQEIECSSCQVRFMGLDDPSLLWSYNVTLLLEDLQGTRIETWLSGREGSMFFQQTIPSNFFSLASSQSRAKLLKCSASLLESKNVIDCCIKAYSYKGPDNTMLVSSKMFGTMMLPI
jgi:hypothetical protein